MSIMTKGGREAKQNAVSILYLQKHFIVSAYMFANLLLFPSRIPIQMKDIKRR